MINKILAHIGANPAAINEFAGMDLSVVFTDTRKRFTEFYRLKAEPSGKGDLAPAYYWFRIVKNKPQIVIEEAISRQFNIMQRLYSFFNDNKKITGDTKLSCCRPVVLLKEFNTVITKECSGQLFNDFLSKNIPFFKQSDLTNYCYNVGRWLWHFHQCFRNNNATSEDIEKQINKYEKKINKCPDDDRRYLTLCHNDYSPRNIFVGKNMVEVIDFVGCEEGLPDEDIKFFTNYISKAKFNLLYTKKTKKRMIEFFLMGYNSGKQQ